jgi:hypothetical protein
MEEKLFEDIICRYPELIENDLLFKGRQVTFNRKRVDVLFEDRHGQILIVELKKGTVLRKHVGQLLDYEGDFISEDNPNVRVMLVGNRVPENLRRSLDHHGFEWKEFTITTLINFFGTKDEPNMLRILTAEKPLVPDIHKTLEQQPHSEKIQTSPPVSNKSISINDIGQKIKCELIEAATNTICRQTDPKLDGASVYFTLSGKKKNWKSKEGSKKAIVYYSRSSNHLVVIPKDTVDRYIFDLLFQKKPDGEGYCLSDKYKNYERKDGRIGLRFKIEDDDRLLVQLEAEAKKNVLPKRLIYLQSDYWPKILPDNIDINSKIIEEIRRICQDFSGGEGIEPIKD